MSTIYVKNKAIDSNLLSNLHYINSSFSFVLPYNQRVSFKEFSELIKKNYSEANEKTSWAINLLETTLGGVTRNRATCRIDFN